MQKVVVFQQNQSGKSKIDGIRKFGKDRFVVKTFDIDQALPDIIDDSSEYLPDTIDADIVLGFLKHHDLSADLAVLSEKLDIPVVMSGKKITTGQAICPPTWCSLARQDCLGEYGKFFGAPRIKVEHDGQVIQNIEVFKGAPCGATWYAAEKVKGLSIEKALTRFGLEVQFFCSADPAAWDPFYSKSPVHMAADVHAAVLKKALKESEK